MGRQLPPSHLKVPPGPHAFPQRYSLGETVVVNQYTGLEKAIPAIPSLPGFRTSAAFLTSLSANLRIDPDLPSPLGTPTSFRTGSYYAYPHLPTSLSYSTLPDPYIPYPSSAEAAIMPLSEASAPVKPPMDELPQLSTYTAESEDDRIEGLRLVADSVAQQRQVASKMMIFHPINLAILGLVVAIVTQYILRASGDLFLLGTTLGGIAMTFLIAVRYVTGGYIGLAEDIDMDWLGEDRLVVAKWGKDVIGALVLGWADHDAAKKRGRRRRGKAVIRAWTVMLKYRGKGVGEGLLEEAVKVAGERGADGIIFDADHANSKRILPAVYNAFLDKQEAKAEKALRKVADDKGNFRQRQSSPTWGSR
jgi:GNAT superfamily N-acetyltransferase